MRKILLSLQCPEANPLKRYILFGLLVTILCTPLLFVLFLVTAATLPAMDKLTLAMPQTVRAAVAQIAYNTHRGARNQNLRERVLKLDPNNTQFNRRSGTIVFSADEGSAVTLNKLGLDQEHAGDPCTAEDTFTQANSHANGGNTQYLRNMGRAAYECGRYAYSVSEFSAAQDRDAQDLAAEPDAADLDADLSKDREWLSLAYSATRQPQLANEACLRAHTTWKACRCTLDDKKPLCIENPSHQVR